MLLNQYGVRFDSTEGKWFTVAEWLEKHYGVRFDEDEGRWVTTENKHRIHINEKGEIDKGNPYVLKAIHEGQAREKKLSELRVGARFRSRGVEYEKINDKEYVNQETGEVVTARQIREYNGEQSTAGSKEEARAKAQTAKDAHEAAKTKAEQAWVALQSAKDKAWAADFEAKSRAKVMREATRSKDKWQSELDEATSRLGGMTIEEASKKDPSELTDEQFDALNDAKRAQRNLKRANTMYENAKREKAEFEKQSEEENEKTQELQNKYADACAELTSAIEAKHAAVLEAYPTPKDCETTQEVGDYLKAKGYFKQAGGAIPSEGQVDIGSMSQRMAVQVAEHIDSLVSDYPALKGKLGGVFCEYLENPNTYGQADTRAGKVTFNTRWYSGKDGDLADQYQKDVAEEWHPVGTDETSVVDHEFTHVLEGMANAGQTDPEEKAANVVMRRVIERMEGRDPDRNAYLIREQEVRGLVSQYSARNKGAYVDGGHLHLNQGYGRNTEFLAEAIAEARCSEHPREIAVMVREEFEKLLKERGVI